MVRMPLLPFSVNEIHSESELKEIVNSPLVREALFLASPDLYARLGLYIDGNLSPEDAGRVRLALKKYLLRLCGRSTPFGLFANVTHGFWENCSAFKMQSEIQRSTRLDTAMIYELTRLMLQFPEVRDKVNYFSNNTIYEIKNKIRYIECHVVDGTRVFRLSDIKKEKSIMAVLHQAATGKSRAELAESIVDDEITLGMALAFIDEMVENQLLVSELDLKITGPGGQLGLSVFAKKHKISLPELVEIEEALKAIDPIVSANNFKAYSELFDKLRQLSGQHKVDNFIQVDTHRLSTITINKEISTLLNGTLQCLSGLFPAPKNPAWETFKHKFYERYGFERVALCHALDPEIGLGYPTLDDIPFPECSLLRDIDFSIELPRLQHNPSVFQSYLIDRYNEAIRMNGHIELNEAELRPFMQSNAFPSSLYAMASVFGGNDASIDEGNFEIQFRGAYGPSAINLMARFCNLNDELLTLIRETVDNENKLSDGIFAEVVHVDQFRTGNISSRPVLRDYEIPIVTHGGMDAAHTIPLADLTLCHDGERLIIVSERLGCEVIPRLSSAHNHASSTISAYRFLCDMQVQSTSSSVRWDWGLLETASHLPRVAMGRVIVSPERWKISDNEVLKLKKSDNLIEDVCALRKNRRIPRHVIAGETDNKVPIDLDNEEHLEVFLNIIQHCRTLEEFLGYKDLPLRDEKGRMYQHELVVPFIGHKQTFRNMHPQVGNVKKKITRRFGLGSEWLYYKIYCNAKVCDKILTKFIKSLTRELLADGVIDEWFFIRYKDPGYHIRIRFHGKNDFYSTVISRFHQRAKSFVDSGLIREISTDTYERELERYGYSKIQIAEKLFFIDSNCILDLLPEFSQNDDLRWQVGLVMAHDLVTVFDVSQQQRKELMNELQNQFMVEMGAGKNLKASLSRAVRKNWAIIELLFCGQGLPGQISNVLSRRKRAIAPLVHKLLGTRSGASVIDIKSLLKSFIHMTFNRLFPSNPRQYELIIYDFMSQYVKSEEARSKMKVRH